MSKGIAVRGWVLLSLEMFIRSFSRMNCTFFFIENTLYPLWTMDLNFILIADNTKEGELMFSMLPKDYFGFLIDQECKRAERYSNYFGLVRFGFDPLDFEDSVWNGFPNVIKSATRETDIIGILQEKNVGLLLHNVDVHDLPKIADRIQPII